MFLTYINDITLDLTSQMNFLLMMTCSFARLNLKRTVNLYKRISRNQVKKMEDDFNNSKCHVLRMTGGGGEDYNYPELSTTVGNEPLTAVSSHPYLGVEFDSKLSWKVQVQKVKAKGTKTLNIMVRRNFTLKVPMEKSENKCIQALSAQHWNTEALPGTLTKQTESRWLRASKTRGRGNVTQEWNQYSSISDINDKLGCCTLQQRHYVYMLSFLFKSVNNLHGHSLPPHVARQKRTSCTRYSYHPLRTRTDAYLHSFLSRTIRVWNILPSEIVLLLAEQQPVGR